MISVFWAVGVVLIVTIFLCLYRVLRGPGVFNKAIAVNLIGTKTIVLLVIIGYIYQRPIFLDIALVYAMVNFGASIAIAKYLKRGTLA